MMMIIHYDNDDDRSNVEGYNLMMEKLCGAANQNIDKAFDLLRTYEASARDKYLNAKKSTARAPLKAIELSTKETNFIQVRYFHRQSMITFVNYLSQIINLYAFVPKKKYVEDLEDTSDSDSEVSDESSGVEYDSDVDHLLKRLLPVKFVALKSIKIHLAACKKKAEIKRLALLALSEQAENST